jgi:hypothetical protein
MTIAGQTVTVTQAAATQTCTFGVSPMLVGTGGMGGPSSVAVTSGTGCNWTATSNVGWITITSGSSGSGNGPVNYTVAPNSATGTRTGTLIVAGATVFVTQDPVCTFTVTPLSPSATIGGGAATLSVTSGSGCTWTATSSAAWITITGGSSGSGNGTVSYTVAANGTSSSRNGTLTVAGKTVTVSQTGPVIPTAPTNVRIKG